MKKMLFNLLILAASCVTALPVSVAGDFGAGVIIGAPTGLSFKYNLSSRNSVDAALAWSSSIDMHVHADYLWHKPRLFHLDGHPIDSYYGIGARLREKDEGRYKDDDADTEFGARAPVGLRHMFSDPDIEVFAEIALIFDVVPETDADFDAGIGARFFF